MAAFWWLFFFFGCYFSFFRKATFLLLCFLVCRKAIFFAGVAVCVVSWRVRVIGPLATCRALHGLVRWCAAATGKGRLRVRLEVAGAFLARWPIRHVPCDVQP